MWREILISELEQDRTSGDLTTQSLGAKAQQPARAVIRAKSECVWAAEGLTLALGEFGIEATGVLDRTRLKPGDVCVTWKATAEKILTFERTFLNIASFASGIATTTAEMVAVIQQAARGFAPPELRHTRKFMPSMRDISIHAVRVGGGAPHRRDLASSILIKENHIAVAGDIVAATRSALKTFSKVQVEVTSLDELDAVIRAGARAVLLDNFSPEQVPPACARAAKDQVFVEVSGGISKANIAAYVLPGVHAISCGALTHSFTSADLSLKVVP